MDYRSEWDKMLSGSKSKFQNIVSSCETYLSENALESLNLSLRDFAGSYSAIEKLKGSITSFQVNLPLDRLSSMIDDYFQRQVDELEDSNMRAKLAMKDEITAKVNKRIAEIKEYNEGVRARNAEIRALIDAENSKHQQLEVKRQRLLEYAPEILNKCALYGIKVSEIRISNDMFTLDELDALYSQFYDYISSTRSNSNIVVKFRDSTNSSPAALLGAIIGIVALSFTPIYNVLGVIALLYIMYIQAVQLDIVKRYTIMAGLAFNTAPLEYGIVREITEEEFEQEMSEEIDIDSDESLSGVLDSINQRISSLDSGEAIEAEYNKVIAKFNSDYPVMEKELEDYKKFVSEKSAEILSKIEEYHKGLQAMYDDMRSKVKPFGDDFTDDYNLSTKIKLGFNPKSCEYEVEDVGYRNILIDPTGATDIEIIKMVDIVITNYYQNIRPGYIDVTVCDPVGSCRSTAGFYNPEMDTLYKSSTEAVSTVLKEMQTYSDKVLKDTRGVDLHEFNKASSKVGKTCLNYKLFVALSGLDKLDDDVALKKFLSQSVNFGVICVFVTPLKIPNCKILRAKGFNMVRRPIEIDTFEFPINVAHNLEVAFKKTKTAALMWKDFKDTAITDAKMWSWCADERIELDPGFENGDPSKFKGYSVGNTGDIHSIVVGGTGAGKSVFINNIIANVCWKYPPTDVELTLVDFKGSEFVFYLQNEALGRPYMLPHVIDCLCTSDPDYSVSLFHKVRSDADKRYKFLMEKGFKNMYEYNKAMRKAGTPELCLKRRLVIVDEFQVIFTKTDARAQDTLKTDITQIAKVARACGIHLMFCSQSMSGTMSGDILSQFTLRFGLRCPMDVSTAIMGTRFSGDIREKNGYLYVASIDDKKPELQKRFRTPFIPDDQLREVINTCAIKAIEMGYKRDAEPTSYDESTVHNISELQELYDTVLADKRIPGLMVLGERMVYSSKGRHCNVILDRSNNQHMLCAFKNIKDMVMFFKTVMVNIQNVGNSNIMINTQNHDMSYLCEADKYIEEGAEFLYEGTPESKFESIMDFLNNIIESRKQVPDKSTLRHMYVCLFGWDKAVGFGVGSSFKQLEKFGLILESSGTLNIHIIMFVSGVQEITRAVVNGFAHKIAGLVDDKTSTMLFDSDKASKHYEQEDGYMFLSSTSGIERLKIYQSEVTRELTEKELYI